jgi:hypothetical protein
MVMVKFLDRQRTVLREETYSSEEKINYFLDMLENDVNMRKLIPVGTEYVMVDADVFWLDKHDNTLKIRAWL